MVKFKLQRADVPIPPQKKQSQKIEKTEEIIVEED